MNVADPGYRPPPRRRRGSTALITWAVVAVVVAIAVTVTLVELSSSGSVKNQLGSPVFLAGRDTVLAAPIASAGPLLLPDPLGHDRNVYLQHLGPDPALGWVTILAAPPNEAARCVLKWHQDDHSFHDPCSAAVYPADGTGLTRFPTKVLASDRVQIDLRSELPNDYTVTTGTAPPPAP